MCVVIVMVVTFAEQILQREDSVKCIVIVSDNGIVTTECNASDTTSMLHKVSWQQLRQPEEK